MAAPPSGPGKPITDRRQLVEFIETGCRKPQDWRIGTEHEKFVFQLGTLKPAPYEGDWGIRALLEGMTRFGWEPIYEGENPIALKHENGCSITLEPGGQVELAGARRQFFSSWKNHVVAGFRFVTTRQPEAMSSKGIYEGWRVSIMTSPTSQVR